MYTKTHEGFIAIYSENNITIWGQIELYTSSIGTESHNVINSIKITHDDKVVYEAGNTIHYPYNHGIAGIVDFVNIIDDIIFLAGYNNGNKVFCSRMNQVVNEGIQVIDELLHKKSCVTQISVNRLKREYNKALAKIEYDAVQDKNKALIKELETLASQKGLFIDDLFGNPIVTTVQISKKAMREYATISEKHKKEVEDIIVKTFNHEDYENKSFNIWNQSTNVMLEDMIVFLNSYNKKVA